MKLKAQSHENKDSENFQREKKEVQFLLLMVEF